MRSNRNQDPGPARSSAAGRVSRGFPRQVGALEDVFRFLDEALADRALGDRSRLVLQLAVEELFTNMVRHNSAGAGDIVIAVAARGDRVFLELVDPDGIPFDPDSVADPRVNRPIDERRPGGLGLYLVRSLADSLDYRYQDGRMTVSVTTRLE